MHLCALHLLSLLKVGEVRFFVFLTKMKGDATYTVVFDGQFAVHDIKVFRFNGKTFLSMPVQKDANSSCTSNQRSVSYRVRERSVGSPLSVVAGEGKRHA